MGLEIPTPSELLGQLLFDPGMVTRLPVPPLVRNKEVALCSCGAVPKVALSSKRKSESNLTRVVCAHRLYSDAVYSGHVWIGRCQQCGRLFYAAQRDKGILPRRPLEIKRHKIITRAK